MYAPVSMGNYIGLNSRQRSKLVILKIGFKAFKSGIIKQTKYIVCCSYNKTKDNMSLKEYQEKRNFNSTPEPDADLSGSPNHIPVFVIQKHEASHFHFDFRLEVDGVLKSWAVPKGPSMNPKDKRLAIEVEDHPLSYAHFEGVIPEGNYGAGLVEIWDSGVYAYTDKSLDIATAIKHGLIEFKLHGHKLKGLFTLVRTNLDGNIKNWLLIKKDDVFAVTQVYDAKEIPSYDEVFL